MLTCSCVHMCRSGTLLTPSISRRLLSQLQQRSSKSRAPRKLDMTPSRCFSLLLRFVFAHVAHCCPLVFLKCWGLYRSTCVTCWRWRQGLHTTITRSLSLSISLSLSRWAHLRSMLYQMIMSRLSHTHTSSYTMHTYRTCFCPAPYTFVLPLTHAPRPSSQRQKQSLHTRCGIVHLLNPHICPFSLFLVITHCRTANISCTPPSKHVSHMCPPERCAQGCKAPDAV